MAGMPLSFGYIVKDVILEAKSAGDVFAFAKAANTVFGAVAVAVAGVAAIRVFWRHPGVSVTPEAHEGSAALIVPPLVLAVAGTGLVLLLTLDRVTPTHLVKVGFGAAAIAVNAFCIAVVVRRGRQLERGVDEGRLWRASRTVLACFAVGLACAAVAAVLGFRFAIERLG